MANREGPSSICCCSASSFSSSRHPIDNAVGSPSAASAAPAAVGRGSIVALAGGGGGGGGRGAPLAAAPPPPPAAAAPSRMPLRGPCIHPSPAATALLAPLRPGAATDGAGPVGACGVAAGDGRAGGGGRGGGNGGAGGSSPPPTSGGAIIDGALESPSPSSPGSPPTAQGQMPAWCDGGGGGTGRKDRRPSHRHTDGADRGVACRPPFSRSPVCGGLVGCGVGERVERRCW